MKWIIYCMLLAGMLLSFSSKGQILTGPLLGGQISRMQHSSQYEGIDYRQSFAVGYHGGWSYSYSIENSSLAFYSELLYSRKSTVQHYNSRSTRVIKHQRIARFIEVPLLLRWVQPIQRGKTSWFLEIGPQVSYWIGGNGDILAYEFFGSDDIENIPYDIKFSDDGALTAEKMTVSQAKRVQFGLCIGGGVNVPINRKGHKIMIDVRYVSGSTFMANDDSQPIGFSEIEDFLDFKYNTIQVSTAYLFPIDILGLRKGKSSHKIKHKKR